jgi:hypothetical protein
MSDGGIFILIMLALLAGIITGSCFGNSIRHEEVCNLRLAAAHTASDSVKIYRADKYCTFN